MNIQTLVSLMIKDHNEWVSSKKEQGVRFTFTNLKNRLSETDLAYEDMYGLKLIFEDVNLTEADFSGIGDPDTAFHPFMTFKNVNLAGSTFYSSKLKHCKFIDTDLIGSTFIESELYSTIFYRCGLTYVTFRCTVYNCEFTDIDLSYSSFASKKIISSNFGRCTFGEDTFIHWEEPLLKDISFLCCTFNYTMFMNMKLENCKFMYNKFNYPSFVNVDLSTVQGLENRNLGNNPAGLETVVYKNVLNKI